MPRRLALVLAGLLTILTTGHGTATAMKSTSGAAWRSGWSIPVSVAMIAVVGVTLAALEAANPAYETRLYGADRVRIQGKLVGLLRRY